MSRLKFKKLLFVFSFLLSAGSLFGQNSDSVAVKHFYETNAILWQGGSKYFKNSVAYPVKKLDREFNFSLDAKTEFRKYRTGHRIMIAGLITTAGLAISSISTKNRRVSYSSELLILSGVTLGVSLTFHLESRKHLGRSIWYHNRDVLLR